MIFPASNLNTSAQPWGRVVEKGITNLETLVATERVNNAARDAQAVVNIRRLDDSVVGLATQQALTAQNVAAIQTITDNVFVAGTTEIDGYNIKAGTIDATSINAGELTGFTIKTAASGTRVEMSGTTLRFYDSSDLVGTLLSNGSDTLAIVTPMGGGITFMSNGGINISGFMFVGGASFTSISNQGSYTSGGSITIDGSLTRTAMAGSATRYAYVTSAGAIIAGASAPSDIRLKEKISTTSLGLNFINSVNPVEFEFIDKGNPHNQGTQFGVVAQELLEALDSNGITGDNGMVYIPNIPEYDGYYLVNHEQLISPLIKAVQELSAKVEALEAK